MKDELLHSGSLYIYRLVIRERDAAREAWIKEEKNYVFDSIKNAKLAMYSIEDKNTEIFVFLKYLLSRVVN
jgi:hypothetical protein